MDVLGSQTMIPNIFSGLLTFPLAPQQNSGAVLSEIIQQVLDRLALN